MYDYQTKKIFGLKNAILKNNIISPTVFSNLRNTEKNKQYINLQMKSNSLSKDIKLLIDKDSYDKNNSSNKDYQYNKFIERNKYILKRNLPKKSTSLLGIISNYIEYFQNKMDKIKENKKQTLRDKNKINKTVNNLYKMPKINFNTINNINTNISNISPKFLNTKKIKELKHKITLTEINKKININSPIRKFPSITNSKSTKNCINRFELIKKTEKAEKLIKEKNAKIKDRINYKLAEQNLIDWSMKSKLKYAKWKFDIPEIEKYFFNLNAFDQPEKQELIKRKTFYDYVKIMKN